MKNVFDVATKSLCLCLLLIFCPLFVYGENIDKNIDDHLHRTTKLIQQFQLNENENLAEIKLRIEKSHQQTKFLFDDKKFIKGQELIDNLIELSKTLKDDFLTARLYETKGVGKFKQKRYIEAEAIFNQAFAYIQQESPKHLKKKGTLYHQIAMCYKRRKMYEKEAYYHEQALKFHTEAGALKNIASSLRNLANAEYKLGHSIHALDSVIKSLERYKELSDKKAQAETHMLAARIYRGLRRYETSLEHVKVAHSLHTTMGDIGKLAFSSNQMGQLYSQLKKFSQAISFYQATIDLPVKEVPLKARADAYRELAIIDLNIGNFEQGLNYVNMASQIYSQEKNTEKLAISNRIKGELYHAQGAIEKAKNTYQLALKYATESNSVLNRVKILNRLGRSLILLDRKQAFEVFSQALEISIKISNAEEQALSLIGLIEIERGNKNYELALEHSTELLRVKQALYERNERDKLAFAKSQLDSHMLETEVDLLKEKIRVDQLVMQQKSNELEITQQAHTIASLQITKNRYAIALLVFLAIVLGLFGIIFIRLFIASRRKNVELDFLATRDPLTDCLNRRALFEYVARYKASKSKNEKYCVVMVDIDFFKKINDNYGHDKGDEVIRDVATILTKGVRNQDIVARYGGEEFCIVLKNTSVSEARSIAENIREKIAGHQIDTISVTCSFGVSTVIKRKDTIESVITSADQALLYAKRNGRNRVCVYNSELNEFD